MSPPGASCAKWLTRPEAGFIPSKACGNLNPPIRRSPRNCALTTRCPITPQTRSTTANGELYESKLIIPASQLKPDPDIARHWNDSDTGEGAMGVNFFAFTISCEGMIHIVDPQYRSLPLLLIHYWTDFYRPDARISA